MSNKIHILDGAWGTQLQDRGLQPGENPDLWNLLYPGNVAEVANAYVAAGSDIILTNTFGANAFVLKRFDAEDKIVEINRAGVRLSKQAAKNSEAKYPVQVFASVGPTGVMLAAGEVKPDEVYAAFLQQFQALAEEQPDGFIIETMTDPAEAVLAVNAAKTVLGASPPLVAVSFVFDSGKNKDRTMMGTTPEQVVEQMTAAGADIIGANCGQGIDGFVPICKRMRAITDKPLWMKANAGLPEIVDGKTVYRQTAERFIEVAKQLVGNGADYIGGCCGTTPEYIKCLANHLPLPTLAALGRLT